MLLFLAPKTYREQRFSESETPVLCREQRFTNQKRRFSVANQKRRFSVANKDLANQERRFSVTNKYLANQKRRFSADMYSTCRWTDRRWDVKCVVILHPVTLGGGTLPRKQHDFPKGDPTTCDTPQPQATLQQNVKMFVNWRRAPDPGPAT